MQVWIAVAIIYIASGLAFGLWYDRREMKKDVPYSVFPAIAPLHVIRKCFFFSCAFTGFPQICVNLFDCVRLEYFLWRVRRIIRKLP